MYSRVTLVEIDTLRIGIGDALARYRDEVVVHLAEQPGYEGVLVMANPDGRGMVVTLWEDEAAATAGVEAGGFYAEALERFVTIFRQPPGRDHYEVLLADVPAVAATGG